jgi:hypothetical protein
MGIVIASASRSLTLVGEKRLFHRQLSPLEGSVRQSGCFWEAVK